MESKNWKTRKGQKTEIAIIGGGVAGVTAAYRLRNRNIRLFELSHAIGGTSSAYQHEGISFSQGAHYDLAYPAQYGSEVLELLEELDIIRFEPWKNSWGFVDQQHVIPYFRRQQCYDHGAIRKDVIPEGPAKEQFVELMVSWSGKMNLPTRMIAADHQSLGEISFIQFLHKHIEVDENLKRQLDYHMADDYGGNTEQVSAIAGLIYFACRPYYTQSVDLFSPPNGNDYFIRKMATHLDNHQIQTNHLVKSISKKGQQYVLEVLDILRQEIVVIEAEQVIYAGQKHALKYIYPGQDQLFNNSYSPWMVVNLLTKQEKGYYGYWQNEYLGENPKFLGFIDSSVQEQTQLKGYRVLTGYYCLSPSDREYLTTVNDHKASIVQETHQTIENMLNERIPVEAAFIKVMGHAMPVPKPGYLFKDANQHPERQMIYAGVDNGRLPLLFEALDSGLVATTLL
jgi:protoporphyrinogen oxidase